MRHDLADGEDPERDRGSCELPTAQVLRRAEHEGANASHRDYERSKWPNRCGIGARPLTAGLLLAPEGNWLRPLQPLTGALLPLSVPRQLAAAGVTV
jgi:hypothetical protein